MSTTHILPAGAARATTQRRPWLNCLLPVLLLGLSLAGSAAQAQAAGAAMKVQVALAGYVDNDGSGTITRSDVLTYTATASNTGTVPLTNVQFLGLGLAPCPTVATGSDCVRSFTYTVTANDVSQGAAFEQVFANAVELPAGVGSPVTITPVFGGPDLTVTEVSQNSDADRSGSVTLGDVLTYTVTATNSGGVLMHTVNINDSLLTPASVTCSNIAVDAACTLTGQHTVSAAEVAQGQIVDRPSVTSNPTITSGFQYGNEFITPVATPSGAAMSVSITLDRYLDSGQPHKGSKAQFEVVATNAGDVPLSNVTVSNPTTSPASAVCATVAVGATCVLTSIYKVTAADVANGSFGPLTGSATSTEVAGPVSSPSYVAALSPNPLSLLQAVSGNGQSGTPGMTLPVPLTVQLQGTGVGGQVIVFSVLSGSARVTNAEVITDASGMASTQLVLGPNLGPVSVRAQLKFHSPEALFTANNGVLVLADLTLVSGSNQSLSLGSPSAPLVVQLTRGGVPVAGASIQWSATNATLASATSLTDANGKASNSATVHNAGAAIVTAAAASPPAGPISFALNGGVINISGLTPPEQAVANSLDHACPALAALTTLTPAEQDLLAQCNAIAAAGGQNPGQAANALDQLLPHIALLQTNASILAAIEQFDNVKARLAALRSGGGKDHFAGLAFATPDGSVPIGSLGDAALGYDTKPAAANTETGAGFDRWGFFASGNFSNGSSDARTVTPGYGFHSDGLTAGVDYRLNDHMIFGLSAGYSNYSSNVDNVGGGLDTHGWSLSAYSTLFRQDNWYMDGVLTWGDNSYDITRKIMYTLDTGSGTDVVNQTAKSNSSGATVAGSFTLGRDFSRGAWSFGPYARGTYTRITFGSYRETLQSGQPGDGLGLNVASRNATSVASVLGAKLNYASSQSWGVLMPHAEVEWQHEFQDNPDSINASFLQDPTATPFQLRGDSVDTNYFRLGLGVAFQFTHGRSGFFYYEKTIGLSGVTLNNLALGVRMEF